MQPVVVQASEGGNSANVVEVQILGCSAEAFWHFLKWVYMDELEVDEAMVVGVLLQLDCYCLPELQEQCAKVAVPLLCMLNISKMVFAAEQVHEGMGHTLQDACCDFMLQHLDELNSMPAYNCLLCDEDFMHCMLQEFQKSKECESKHQQMR